MGDCLSRHSVQVGWSTASRNRMETSPEASHLAPPFNMRRRFSGNLVALTRLAILSCLLLFTIKVLLPAAHRPSNVVRFQLTEPETERLASPPERTTLFSTNERHEPVASTGYDEPSIEEHLSMVAEDLPLEGECVIDGTGNLLFDCIPVDYRPLFERLPQTALKNWFVPKLHLQIITFNRPESLQRLLKSLLITNYLKDQVTLTFHVEANPDSETLRIINSFAWPFGMKLVRRRLSEGGLMHAIVESWYPASRDDYTIILEDDIEVSPLYYIWAKLTLLRYRYTAGENEPRLFGISLYTPRLQEMNYPRKKFFPDTLFTPVYTPFLWQLPCSWGAIYFPESWQEFHTYLNGRLKTNLSETEVVIPESRSNFWKFSWKKYFIEMIILRGYFMLYPNFLNQTSLSTNHLEPGIHIGPKSRVRLEMMDEFRVPLMQPASSQSPLQTNQPSIAQLFDLPNQTLPHILNLPILNLFAKPTNISALIRYGQSLKPNQHSCSVGEFIVRDFITASFSCNSVSAAAASSTINDTQTDGQASASK